MGNGRGGWPGGAAAVYGSGVAGELLGHVVHVRRHAIRRLRFVCRGRIVIFAPLLYVASMPQFGGAACDSDGGHDYA